MRHTLSLMITSIIMTFTSFIHADLLQIAPMWDEVSVSVFTGVENFRGIPDSEGGNNNGIYFGFNTALPVPGAGKYGFGFQFGGSCAALDFAGRGWNSRDRKSIQGQEFLTMGFFLQPHPLVPLSAGIVYDLMFNQNYSLFALNPTLHQVRGQIAYFLTSSDEIGFWGAYDVKKTRKIQDFGAFDFEITYRSIAQVNIFWRHLYRNGVESNLWLGTPIRNRLNRKNSNRAGKYIVGLELSVPFLESWLLVGKASYMQPGTHRGILGEREYASSISVNLVYLFGDNPNDCESKAWMPYLPLADNSNFFVDAATQTANFRNARY